MNKHKEVTPLAFKQPRIPEYREADGTNRYLRALALFLKDFCMDCWVAVRALQRGGSGQSGAGGAGIGLPSLHIDEHGHLICTYAGNPPPLHIDTAGHLIYTYGGD